MVRESGEEPRWYAPVPQESMDEIKGCAGCEAGRVSDWKTPSAIVERPMRGRRLVRYLETKGLGGGGGRTDVSEADEEDGNGFGGC